MCCTPKDYACHILVICSPSHGYLSCLQLPTKMHRWIIQIVVLKFFV